MPAPTDEVTPQSSDAPGVVVDSGFAADLDGIARIDAVPVILEVICRTTGLGFSAVARVTEDRWIACAVRDEIAFGLQPGGELEIRTTICDEIRESGKLVVIDHVAEDPEFRDHHVPKQYGFQSYISVPIRRPNGQFFGTLCGIDPKPARLKTPATVGMFKLFADLIGFHLDAQERLTVSEEALRAERETAELREQFIAVLGHDLRNPLASITAGAAVLNSLPLGERALPVVARIQRSGTRMAELIENVLDFARGRLGGGLPITQTADESLPVMLDQVIAELQAAWPHRVIRSRLTITQSVACDSARIAQLCSNLLANALTHGDPASPVSVYARTCAEEFELTVVNVGEAIPLEIRERLFQPYVRASARPGQRGLGLGLYIASEIARAHQGSLGVESTAQETRFTFRMSMLAR
jgi:signal transduction histidine kinase